MSGLIELFKIGWCCLFLAQWRFLSLVGMLFFISGCALPGIGFDDYGSSVGGGWFSGLGEDSDAAHEALENPDIIQITPALISKQSAFLRDQSPFSVLAESDRSFLEWRDADYVYRIGVRDILTIIVWDHPELTSPAGEHSSEGAAGRRVRANGTIFFPFVGALKVAGRTVDEVRRDVSNKLRPYIKNPQVDVQVAVYRSKKYYVTGEVERSGTQYITDVPPTLLEALNEAGGLAEEADRRVVLLSRNGRQYELDLYRLYRYGDERNNVLLMPGDTVHVPNNRENRVFVMGEVGQQTSLPVFEGRMSLADAISSVNGINLASADARRIFVIRASDQPSVDRRGWLKLDSGLTNTPDKSAPPFPDVSVFQLNISSPAAFLLAERFELQSRDVVFVSSTRLTSWNRVLNQILPTFSALFQSAAVVRIFE